MLIKTMKDARGILAVSDDEFEQMTKQALSTPLSEILHGLDTLQGALDKMYRGGDRRVELEMALIKLCSPELDDSNAALIRRIGHWAGQSPPSGFEGKADGAYCAKP